MSLPTLRNKLGGHGQGEEVVSVPRPYAEFAVGLAACLTTFCVEMRTAREGSKESPAALPAPAEPNEQLFADEPPF